MMETFELPNDHPYSCFATNFDDCLNEWKKVVQQKKDRIEELEAAIKKHRDEFPDEPLMGEKELWTHIK